MIGARANRVLDRLHQATVAVLVVSTLYFGVEAVRATMAIQEHRYKTKQQLTLEAKEAAEQN
eukprot:gene13101-13229_t